MLHDCLHNSYILLSISNLEVLLCVQASMQTLCNLYKDSGISGDFVFEITVQRKFLVGLYSCSFFLPKTVIRQILNA